MIYTYILRSIYPFILHICDDLHRFADARYIIISCSCRSDDDTCWDYFFGNIEKLLQHVIYYQNRQANQVVWQSFAILRYFSPDIWHWISKMKVVCFFHAFLLQDPWQYGNAPQSVQHTFGTKLEHHILPSLFWCVAVIAVFWCYTGPNVTTSDSTEHIFVGPPLLPNSVLLEDGYIIYDAVVVAP